MEHKLMELGLFSMGKRRFQVGLIAAFQEDSNKAGQGLFTRAWSHRAEWNGFKLKEARFRVDIRKKFFPVRVEALAQIAQKSCA